jgi:hypothetical protein
MVGERIKPVLRKFRKPNEERKIGKIHKGKGKEKRSERRRERPLGIIQGCLHVFDEPHLDSWMSQRFPSSEKRRFVSSKD